MAWTYDPTQLASSKKDQVRFILGDTDENDPLMQDEEIIFLLEINHENALLAAIQGCMNIISSLSRIPDFKVGPYSESHANRLGAYKLLYDQLLKYKANQSRPVSNPPTTKPVFSYDMMVMEGCDHEQ